MGVSEAITRAGYSLIDIAVPPGDAVGGDLGAHWRDPRRGVTARAGASPRWLWGATGWGAQGARATGEFWAMTGAFGFVSADTSARRWRR